MLNEALSLASTVAKIADNLTDADQSVVRLMVKRYKSLLKACNYAEQIFIGKKDDSIFRDNSFDGTDKLFFPRKNNEQYWELRGKFDKYD